MVIIRAGQGVAALSLLRRLIRPNYIRRLHSNGLGETAVAVSRWGGSSSRRWAASASGSASDKEGWRSKMERDCDICGELVTGRGSSLCKRCCQLDGANVKNLNPFDFFGCTTARTSLSFRVNVDDLEAQYRERMKLIHPDRVSVRTKSEKVLAQSVQQTALWASLLDQIKDPVSRTFNILKWQYGFDQNEDSAEIDDQMLLMQIIEDTEIVMTTTDLTLLETYRKTWSKRLENIVEHLAEYFDKLESQKSDEMRSNTVNSLVTESNKYRIIEKLIGRIGDQIITINQGVA